jgi:predicted PurR-regulated permease PerM
LHAPAPPLPSRPLGAWRALLGAAAFVVVVAGLRAGATLLLPVVIAGFVTVVSMPVKERLCRWGVPELLAVLLVMALAVATVVLLALLVGGALATFTRALPSYEAEVDELADAVLERLHEYGIAPAAEDLPEALDAGRIWRLVADLLGSLVGVLSNAVLILLIAFFMLGESAGMAEKVRRALGDPRADLSGFLRVRRNVVQYVVLKTSVGLVTGVATALLCLVAGVSTPVLWGLLAFLLNYIPQIGSVVAAVPPVLLALLQSGWGAALIVGLGKVAIDQVLGNVIEPRIMGRSMGLSALVVFLSLLFWGYVWGPVGVLLAVPLTMVVKIALDSSPQTRAAGILLGPSGSPEPEAAPP